MEKVYLEKRFYPKQPIWTVSFLCGLLAIVVVFLTLSFISAVISSALKISINNNIIEIISTPIAVLIMLISFWYIPTRLSSDLSYIKVNDEGVEFSHVNLKLQTITKFLKWDEIELFAMVNRRSSSLKETSPHLYLATWSGEEFKLPNQPFQTETDRKDFFYETNEFIKIHHPKIAVMGGRRSKQEIL